MVSVFSFLSGYKVKSKLFFVLLTHFASWCSENCLQKISPFLVKTFIRYLAFSYKISTTGNNFLGAVLSRAVDTAWKVEAPWPPSPPVSTALLSQSICLDLWQLSYATFPMTHVIGFGYYCFLYIYIYISAWCEACSIQCKWWFTRDPIVDNQVYRMFSS